MKNTEKSNIIQLVIKLAIIFMQLFLLGLLNRTGSLILLWKEEPLGSITHDEGFGYYAYVRDENISDLNLPFYLKEDETIIRNSPLSVNEDITASIKRQGLGGHKIMENNDLYFSASDNDPEAHEYSIISPVIIRNRHFLILSVLAAISAVVILIQIIKTGEKTAIRDLFRWGSALLFALLLIPWDKMIYSSAPASLRSALFQPLLQRNLIFLCLLFGMLLGSAILCRKNRLLIVLSIPVVLLNTIYYLIPEWNYFGQRADSADYLEHYSASSIRTPGYPVFIEAVYDLTGSEGLDELRLEKDTLPDDQLKDSTLTDSRGLVNVARAQKIVLAAAFLILFSTYARFYPLPWFVFLSQIILCSGSRTFSNSSICRGNRRQVSHKASSP